MDFEEVFREVHIRLKRSLGPFLPLWEVVPKGAKVLTDNSTQDDIVAEQPNLAR